VKKSLRPGAPLVEPPEVLEVRGRDALHLARFREAIDAFKPLVRLEPRVAWKEGLADAYQGRARELAAKSMFKEAAMVLENTADSPPTGAVRDPDLYVSCLLRDNQQQKAAGYLLHHPPVTEEAKALAAALLVIVAPLPTLVPGATAEQTRWRDLAMAARKALAAWSDGAPAEEIDGHLNRVSLRSPFRPVRLLLKALITSSKDAERTRRILESLPPRSPFYPLGQAVAAAILRVHFGSIHQRASLRNRMMVEAA
jgi:tetratricopeptide (TPR) repeat protein